MGPTRQLCGARVLKQVLGVSSIYGTWETKDGKRARELGACGGEVTRDYVQVLA